MLFITFSTIFYCSIYLSVLSKRNNSELRLSYIRRDKNMNWVTCHVFVCFQLNYKTLNRCYSIYRCNVIQ